MKTQAHHHLQTGAETNMSRCCNGKANAVSSELPNQTEVNLARHVRIQKPSDFIPFLNKFKFNNSISFFLKVQYVTFIYLHKMDWTKPCMCIWSKTITKISHR